MLTLPHRSLLGHACMARFFAPASVKTEFASHKRLHSIFSSQLQPKRPVIPLQLDLKIKKRAAFPFRRNPFSQVCERHGSVLKAERKSISQLDRFDSGPLDFEC